MRIWGHSGGSSGFPPSEPTDPEDDYTVEWAWAGNVTDDSATITVRSPDASAITLRYSTDPGLAGFSTVAGTEGADEVWRFHLTGLDPDTRYYYGFAGSALTGTFRSFPTEGEPASFTIAAASCCNANSVVFTKIAARDLLFFWHFGDRHYANISTNNVGAFRTAYANVMARSNERAMHLAVSVPYVFNDHDYGANDSHGGSASRPAAQQVYREHVPHYPLPADTREDGDGEIYHTWVAGRVRFINLDDRSERSPNGATDNSSKTMLGADQKQWLKDTLLAAIEPLIIIHVGSPWNGNDSISWGRFTTERDELTDFFAANDLTDRLLIVNGDHHWMAFDDGTNAPGGIPTLAAAPLSQSFTSNNGTWTTAIVKSQNRQYATIAVDDDGTDVTVTIKGWAVTTGGVESEVMAPTPLVY